MDRPLPSFGIPVADMVPSRLLEARAQELPDSPFLHFETVDRTFGEIDAAAARLAGALADLGVEGGARVGVFLRNCPEFVETYFALGKLGAVAVPINTAYRGYMLEYLLNDTGCRFIVADEDYLDRIEASRPNLEQLRTVIVRGEPRSLEAFETFALAELEGEPMRTRDAVVFNDVNSIIYTSGTTGPSKGVQLTHAHSVAKAIEVIKLCEIDGDDCIYAPVPLFHSFGLQRGVVTAVVSGCRCAFRERFSASGYWPDVRRLRATVGFCVFTIPQILKKAEPTGQDRDHTLRCLYNGRADREFEGRFGVRLIEGYGLTEAGVAMYVRPGEVAPPGSCGRVSEDWEVRLVDGDDNEVLVGEIGEITLRPRYPWLITTGYVNKPEATVSAWQNLWFHTGDLATVDADGWYSFRDRKKDAIRRRGENVSSWEVEQVIREHPSIGEAAVIPFPSPVGEDDVRVVATLNEGAALTPVELLAFCIERLPDFMVPRYVEFRDELPRTPTGRIEKYRLRDEGLGPGAFDRGDPRERPQPARAD